MATVFVLLIVLASLLGAAASVQRAQIRSHGSRSPPVTPATAVMSYSEIIPAEGVTHDCVIRQNKGPPGVRRVNCSTADGSYTAYTNFGTGILAFVFFEDWKPTCYTYPIATEWVNKSMPANTWPGFVYSKRARIAGEDGDVYRSAAGRYLTSVTFIGGVPKVVTANEMGTVRGYAHSFEAAESPLSDFDLPAACDPTHDRFGGHLTAAEVRALPKQFLPDGMTADDLLLPQNGESTKVGRPSSSDSSSPSSRAEFLSLLLRTKPPKVVDHSRFATPVRDQGRCGGCWSFSSAALAEIYRYRAANVSAAPKNTSGWLSMQSVIDCAHGYVRHAIAPAKGCFGGDPIVALEHIAQVGIPAEVDYPYDAVNGHVCKLKRTNPAGESTAETTTMPVVKPFASAHVLDMGNVTQIESAVANFGGAVALINVPYSLAFYGGYTEVYSDPACTPGTIHAVPIVGYGETASGQAYWLIKNSFGANSIPHMLIPLARVSTCAELRTSPEQQCPRESGAIS